jgi:hypothetical protein
MPGRLLALLAVLACGVTGAGGSAAAPPAGLPVYAIAGGQDDASISRRNPRTLTQIGPAAPLEQWGIWPALSPSGSLLAALSLNTRPPSIGFLDVRRMRWRPAVELPPLGLAAFRWVDERTVLVLGERPDGLRAIAVDAQRGRIVRRSRVAGHLEAQYAEPTSAGTALLLRPPVYRQLGPVLVGVVRPSGAVKVVEIGRISIGSFQRPRRPALIADAVSGTAYVLGGLDEPVAEVDLRTMRVAYHRIRGVQPLPETVGSDRHGVWLEDGRLALVGFDDARQTTRRLGLSLVDTRTWKLRRLDRTADFLVQTGDLLLGLHQDGSMGAFGIDGRRRFARPEPVFQIGYVAGNDRYAYAWNLPPRPDGTDGGALVIDARSGSIVARPTLRALNLLLSPGS